MTGQPLLITVAPNGAYKQRADHQRLPLTAAELADCAAACLDAGAAMLHLHVRDAAGQHLLDAAAYRDAIAHIRKRVGQRLVLQVTTESGRRYAPRQQMALVRELMPEAVSVAPRELLSDPALQDEVDDFFAWLAASPILPQIILYDSDDLQRWRALQQRAGLHGRRDFLLFVLGRYSVGQRSSPSDLLPFLSAHGGSEPWAVCAFGAEEHACMKAAAAAGGHVRVGFENNLLLPDGSVASDNAALVALAAGSAKPLGRSLVDADWVRSRFAA